jgi:hypothetical protein
MSYNQHPSLQSQWPLSNGNTGYMNTKQRVKKFIIQNTTGYQDMVTRPLTMTINPAGYDNVLNEAVKSMRMNTRVLPASISQMASTYISPSSAPESIVAIPNGWNSKRLRFILVIEYTSSLNHITESMVYGYTDYMGVSTMMGTPSFDDQMVFFVNGVVDLRVTTQVSQFGNRERKNVIDFSDVVYKNYDNDNNAINKTTYKVVPESIFNTMASNEISSTLPGGFVADLTSAVVTMPTKINKDASRPSMFISSTINSYIASLKEMSNISCTEVLSNAASYASDQYRECEFIRQIRQFNGHGGRFKLNDLKTFDANCMSPGVFAPVISNTNNYIDSSSYAPWTSNDIETQMAQYVTSVLPAIMVKNNITEFKFTSTNDTVTGEVLTVPSEIRSNISELDNSVSLVVCANVNNEIIPAVSFSGEVKYMLQVACSVYSNIEVHISINGGPITPYISPAFASALGGTNLTTSNTHLSALSGSLSNIFNEVIQSMDGQYNTTQQSGAF